MAGLGEVKVSLGLDTTAATQQLKKFFSQFGEPVKDPLKTVDKSLDSTVKKAKDLGFEWDKTSKQFKSSQGFTQTLDQMKTTLSATAKAAKDSGVSFKTMGNIVKTSGEQYKMIAGGMEQARQKMQGLGTQAKTTSQELKNVSNGSVASGLNTVGTAAKNASTGFDALGNEAKALTTELNFGKVGEQNLRSLGDVADATTGDMNELGNASTGLVNKLKNIGTGSSQGLNKLGTDAKGASTGITSLGNAATDTAQDLIKIYNGGKGLAQLSTSAKTLGTSFTQASNGTKSLAGSMKNLGSAAPGLKSLGNAVTGMATSTKSAATGFGSLGQALQKANQQAQPLTALPMKIKPINAAMKSAGQAAMGAGTQFQKAGQQSKTFTSTVNEGFKQMLIGIPQGIGMAIGNTLIAPLRELAGVVPAAVEEFRKLDESLRLTLEISGAGAAKFGELKDAILSVSSVTAATATDIAAIAQSLSKAGFSLDEVKVAMKPIAQAAEATGTAYDAMGDIVVSALGQFRLSAEDASRVADTLVVAANSSNQSVTDLGEAFKYVGPVASAMGNSIEDVSVALGVLANAGIKGSSAGTALRTAMSNLATAAGNADAEFLKLSRGSKRIATALKLVQAKMTDANGELKTGTDFIYALKDAMEDLPQQEQALVAKALAGQEGLSAMNALIAASSEEIDGLADSLANAAGAAESQASKAMAGLSGQIKLLESNISAALATIGEVVATVLTPVVTTIRVILEAFNALPGPIKTAAVALGLLGGAILTATVAMNAFAAASKTAFGTQLIAQIKAFTASINAQTIATSINGMVTGFKNMASVLSGGLIKGLNAATKGIKGFTTAVNNGTLFSGVADGVKKLGTAFQGVVKPAGAVQTSLNLAAAGGTNLGTAAAAGATGVGTLSGAAAGAKATLGAMGVALKGLLVALGPIALAVGGVVLAVKAVADYMGKWNEAQEPLRASTKMLTDEVKDQGITFESVAKSMDPMGGVLEGLAGGYDNWGKSIEDALGPIDRLLGMLGPLWGAFKFGMEMIGRFDGWLKQKTQVAALNDEHAKFQSGLDKTNQEIEENTAKMARLNPLSEEYGKLAKRNAELSGIQVKATEDRVAAIDKQIEALMKNEKHNKLVIDKLKEHKAELQAGLAIHQANEDALKAEYDQYLENSEGMNSYVQALDAANKKRAEAEAELDSQAWAAELQLVEQLKEGHITEAEAKAAAVKQKLALTNKVIGSYEEELQAIEDLYATGQMSAEEYESKVAELNAKTQKALKDRIDLEKEVTAAVAAAVGERLDKYLEEVQRMSEAYGKVYEMLNSLTSIGTGGIGAFKSLADQMTGLRLTGADKVKNRELKSIDEQKKRRMAMIDASGASDEKKTRMKEAAEEAYQKKREAAEERHAEQKRKIMQDQIRFEETAHKANMKLKELELVLWREQAVIANQVAQQEIKVAKLKAKAAGASAEDLAAYDETLTLLQQQGELIDTQFELKKKVLDVQGRTTEAAIAQKAAANDVNSEYSGTVGSITALQGEMQSFAQDVDTAIKKVTGIKDGLDPIPDHAEDVFNDTMSRIDGALGKADFATLKAALEKQVGPRQAEIIAKQLTEAYDKQGTVAADRFGKNFLDRFGTAGAIPKNWIADQLKVALQQANGITETEAQKLFAGLPDAIPVDQVAKILGRSVGGGYEEGLQILKNTPLPGQTLGAEQLTSQFSGAITQGAIEGAQEANAPLMGLGGMMLKGITDVFVPGLTALNPEVGQWATNTGNEIATNLTTAVTNQTQNIFTPLAEQARGVGPALMNGLEQNLGGLEGIGTRLGQQFESWGIEGGQRWGEALVRDGVNATGDLIQGAADVLIPGMGTITTAIENDWMGLGTVTGNLFGEENVQALIGWGDEVQNTIANFFADGNRVEENAAELGRKATEAIGDAMGPVQLIVDETADNVFDAFGNMIPKEIIKQELIESLAINNGTSLAEAEKAFASLPDLLPKEEIQKQLGLEAIGGGVNLGKVALQEIKFDPETMTRLGTDLATGIQDGIDRGGEGIDGKAKEVGNVYGQKMGEGIKDKSKEGFDGVADNAEKQGQKAATKFTGPMKKKAQEMRKAFDTEFKAISKQFNTAFKEANFEDLAKGLKEAIGDPITDAVEELEKLKVPASLATSMDATKEAASVVGQSGMAQEIKTASDASRPLSSNMRSAKSSISSAVGPARSLATQLERAARAAERAARARFAGGPVQAGQTYQVNEFGQEMFQSSSGRISEIKAPAFGSWRAPSSGTVIPAHIANEIRAQQDANKALKGLQQNTSSGAAGARHNRTAHAGGPNYAKQMVKELKNLANAGGTTTNNIQIQSDTPIRDASHILIQANRLKNLRRRR